MIFLSLRVAADAEGGLKNRAQQRPVLQGSGAVSLQQTRHGIYRGIACRSLFQYINRSSQFQPQSERQVHWGAYPEHWQFSIRFQNWPACPHSLSSSDGCGQFLRNRSRHLGICPFYCEGGVSSSQPHDCQIAPPHPAFSSHSV